MYKSPFFSQYQDLVCDITYLDPINNEATQILCARLQLLRFRPGARPVSQQSQSASGGRLTASTELMQNYVHGEIVSPTGKFEALQSVDGHALLFSVDSSGILNIFEEQSGSSHTGSQVHDLSTATIRSQFAGREDDAVVRIFDVGQSAKDATIGLMMVVELLAKITYSSRSVILTKTHRGPEDRLRPLFLLTQ